MSVSTLSQSRRVLFKTKLRKRVNSNVGGGSTGPDRKFKLKLTNSTRGVCSSIENTSFQLFNLFCAKSNSLTVPHFFRNSSGSPAQSISQSFSTSKSGTLKKNYEFVVKSFIIAFQISTFTISMDKLIQKIPDDKQSTIAMTCGWMAARISKCIIDFFFK